MFVMDYVVKFDVKLNICLLQRMMQYKIFYGWTVVQKLLTELVVVLFNQLRSYVAYNYSTR